jgi:hypothetical protein
MIKDNFVFFNNQDDAIQGDDFSDIIESLPGDGDGLPIDKGEENNTFGIGYSIALNLAICSLFLLL